MHGAGDVRIEDVPDAHLIESTDAVVIVTRAAICGSDLWPYKTMEHDDTGRRMGHEFIGVVDAVGADVRTVRRGELVVAPFLYSDGTCIFCRQGLHSSCLHGGRYGFDDVDGGQGEAVRVTRGGRNPRQAAGRSRRRVDAVAPDPHRRDGDRSSRSRHRASRRRRRTGRRPAAGHDPGSD
jgi:threonine dehydrogenase-like Zn-dependent dehydrogenase